MDRKLRRRYFAGLAGLTLIALALLFFWWRLDGRLAACSAQAEAGNHSQCNGIELFVPAVHHDDAYLSGVPGSSGLQVALLVVPFSFPVLSSLLVVGLWLEVVKSKILVAVAAAPYLVIAILTLGLSSKSDALNSQRLDAVRQERIRSLSPIDLPNWSDAQTEGKLTPDPFPISAGALDATHCLVIWVDSEWDRDDLRLSLPTGIRWLGFVSQAPFGPAKRSEIQTLIVVNNSSQTIYGADYSTPGGNQIHAVSMRHRYYVDVYDYDSQRSPAYVQRQRKEFLGGSAPELPRVEDSSRFKDVLWGSDVQTSEIERWILSLMSQSTPLQEHFLGAD
jgi:hypothetical protein